MRSLTKEHTVQGVAAELDGLYLSTQEIETGQQDSHIYRFLPLGVGDIKIGDPKYWRSCSNLENVVAPYELHRNPELQEQLSRARLVNVTITTTTEIIVKG